MVNVLTPIPAILGVTGQLVVIGVGIGALQAIDETGKKLNKNIRKGRLTDL